MRKSKTSLPYGQFDAAYYESEGYREYLKEHENIGRESIVEPLFSIIHPQPDWSFLDVGCAMGGTLLALDTMGYACQGAEVSSFCLEHSPMKHKMVFGETFHLPFPDKAFDVVINCCVFEYLTVDQAMRSIDEFARVARRFVALWVFSPDSRSWTEEHNPDPVRIDDTKSITKEEYIDRFTKNGMTLHEFRALDDMDDESYVPNWFFVFRHDMTKEEHTET